MEVPKLPVRLKRPWRALAVSLGLAFGLTYAPGVMSQEVQLRLQPTKVVGPDACGECHKAEVAVWTQSLHSKTFKEMPRRKKAKEIAKNLGLRRIKAESQCLTCHFTSSMRRDKVRPIAGITCESCHGAGKGWIKLHADFGGKTVTRETETPEHRKERFAKSEAAGMIRPAKLYDVAANCFGCHTVPNEKLVNVGGHKAGSDFELVAWTQGEIRHNVWYSKENQEASRERQCLMYIVGKALDLEYALRGVAKATKKAKYAVSMARRAKAAAQDMKDIAAVVSVPEIEAIMAAAATVKLRLNNQAQLIAAADKIGAAAKTIAEKYDGSVFAAIDSMLPEPAKYKGKPAKYVKP